MDDKQQVSISVIMAVYNTEKYLKRSIESVLNQSFADFELICVDDKSTDKSLEILKQYAEIDNRIKVISNTINEGAGVSKNIGLSCCQGKYVTFIDSDDFIEASALDDLYHYAEEYRCDDIYTEMHIANEYGIIEIEEQYFERVSPEMVLYQSGEKLLEQMIERKSVSTAAGRHFVKASLLKQYNIVFQEKNVNDDFRYVIMILLKAGKVMHLNRAYYYYCQRSDSIRGKSKSILAIEEYLRQVFSVCMTEKDSIISDKLLAYEVKNCCNRFLLLSLECRNIFLKKISKDSTIYNYFLKMLNEKSYDGEYFRLNEKMIEELLKYDKIYIYGAGMYGVDIMKVLENNDIHIEGFIVTEGADQMDIPYQVWNISEYQNSKNAAVIIGVSKKYRTKIIGELQNRGIKNYISLVDD